MKLFRSAFFVLLLAAVAAHAQVPVKVALRGYDPVAYFTESRAVQGDPRYSYDWDEARYHFMSAKHRDMFAADPERFAPQFGGYCTGSLSRGVRNEGHPEALVIVDGRPCAKVGRAYSPNPRLERVE